MDSDILIDFSRDLKKTADYLASASATLTLTISSTPNLTRCNANVAGRIGNVRGNNCNVSRKNANVAGFIRSAGCCIANAAHCIRNVSQFITISDSVECTNLTNRLSSA